MAIVRLGRSNRANVQRECTAGTYNTAACKYPHRACLLFQFPLRPRNGPMDIFDHLKQAGGIARTAQLLGATILETGYWASDGPWRYPARRGIFLAPDCDVDLAAAIQHNGRLTCASAYPTTACGSETRPGCTLPATMVTATASGAPDSAIRGPSELPVAAVEDAWRLMRWDAWRRRHQRPWQRLPSGCTACRWSYSGTSCAGTGPHSPPCAAGAGSAGGVHSGGRCAAPVQEQRHRIQAQVLLPEHRTGGFPPRWLLIVEIDGFAFHSKAWGHAQGPPHEQHINRPGLRRPPLHAPSTSPVQPGEGIGEIRYPDGQGAPGDVAKCAPSQLLPP